MSFEYFLFIFISSIAVFQIASAWQGLEYLLFLKNKILTFILSFIFILASYYWFFYVGGKETLHMKGSQQLILFPLGILSGTLYTLLISSLINDGGKASEKSKEILAPGEGLEILEYMTYWQAFRGFLLRK